MLLTARGLMFAGIAVLSFLASLESADLALRIAAALSLAILLVDLLFIEQNLGNVRIRLAPRHCIAGKRFVDCLVLQVAETKRTLGPFKVQESASRSRNSSVLIRSLAPGEHLSVKLDARFRERGQLQTRRFELTTLSLLGAYRRRAYCEVPTEVWVEPARLALDDMLARSFEAWLNEVRPSSLRSGEDFWSLRELREGEDMRRTHAQKSAAAGRLLVRQTRGSALQRVELILDLRAERRTATQQARFELALRFAASFADYAQQGDFAFTARIVGCEQMLYFDLEQNIDRLSFLRAVTIASPQPLHALDDELLNALESAGLEAAQGLARILVEAGVEDAALLAKLGKVLRPLHVHAKTRRA